MVEIFYHRLGPGNTDQIPLLCLHTVPLDSSYFQYSLSEHQIKRPVFLVDLPNHGQSNDLPQDQLDFQTMATEIKDLLEEVDIPKIDILGHGIGGFVAQHIVLLFPDLVRSLILVNSAADKRYRTTMAWNIREQYSKVTIQALEEYRDKTDDKSIRVRFTQALATYFHPSNAEKAKQIMDNATRIATKAYVHLGRDVIPHHSIRDKLRDIKVNTLIIGSVNDVWPIEASKIMRNDIIHAKYYEFKGGHFPMLEEPRKFWRLIEKFLET